MNILLLTHRVPYPPNRGDRIRAYHLLRFLASRHQVSLACLADEGYDAETYSELQKLTSRLEIVRQQKAKRWGQACLRFTAGRTATSGLFHQPELHRILQEWKKDTKFDCIIAFCSSMVPYAFALSQQEVPVLVDLVDVDSQKWLDYAEQASGVKKLLYRTEGNRLRKFEQKIAEQAASVVLVSEAEADIYRTICPNEKTHAITNGVDGEYFQSSEGPSSSQPFSCVFVGALDYGANIDALNWFCKEVWPNVIRKHAQAHFTIVGRQPTSAVKNMANLPGVTLVANVPDIRPYLQNANIAIAPLRIARGVQNKILEAMAMGKAVIASPEALAGIKLQLDLNAVVANTPSEWCKMLTDLWDSSEKRDKLGSEARKFVQSNHVWSVTLQKWERLLLSSQVQSRSLDPQRHLPALSLDKTGAFVEK